MPSDFLFEEPSLQIPDADVSFVPEFDLGQPPQEIIEHLVASTNWREESITLFGKSYLQPRLFAWHGDPNISYRYSGLSLTTVAWTSSLLELKRRVDAYCQCEFNSVLLNYYRDHNDSMGMHSDDEHELGAEPVIASLSLGETRTFLMKHKHRKDLKRLKLALPSGSLLVMRGATQENWKHGIDKQKTLCGPRLNLTFRTVRL